MASRFPLNLKHHETPLSNDRRNHVALKTRLARNSTAKLSSENPQASTHQYLPQSDRRGNCQFLRRPARWGNSAIDCLDGTALNRRAAGSSAGG